MRLTIIIDENETGKSNTYDTFSFYFTKHTGTTSRGYSPVRNKNQYE